MFCPDYSKLPKPLGPINIKFTEITMPIIKADFPKINVTDFIEECHWLEQVDLLKGINHGD